MIHRDEGFSLLEMMVSAGLLLGVTAAVLSVMSPAREAFLAAPAAADIQQRLRTATETLHQDLLMAGGGPSAGKDAGPLSYFFAPVMPYRQGRVGRDPPATFRTDTITLFSVPQTAAQTSTGTPMLAQSGDVQVNVDPGCPNDDELCGFSEGMRVLVFDDTGAYDTFTITGAQASTLHLQHDLDDWAKSYDAGSRIVQIESHTYYLESNAATRTHQLMVYGGGDSDVPVVDNVVGLSFEYAGDPAPPTMRKGLSDTNGPWTTYGPRPPAPSRQTTAYPAGENCVFTNDGSPTPAPRLPVLGHGTTTMLVRLMATELTDGPWCPDANSPHRFDADLLRIRRIGVTVRVQSADEAFRGPAGVLFAKGGASRSGHRFVPDQEVRFQVSPRNLNLGR